MGMKTTVLRVLQAAAVLGVLVTPLASAQQAPAGSSVPATAPVPWIIQLGRRGDICIANTGLEYPQVKKNARERPRSPAQTERVAQCLRAGLAVLQLA